MASMILFVFPWQAVDALKARKDLTMLVRYDEVRISCIF